MRWSLTTTTPSVVSHLWAQQPAKTLNPDLHTLSSWCVQTFNHWSTRGPRDGTQRHPDHWHTVQIPQCSPPLRYLHRLTGATTDLGADRPPPLLPFLDRPVHWLDSLLNLQRLLQGLTYFPKLLLLMASSPANVRCVSMENGIQVSFSLWGNISAPPSPRCLGAAIFVHLTYRKFYVNDRKTRQWDHFRNSPVCVPSAVIERERFSEARGHRRQTQFAGKFTCWKRQRTSQIFQRPELITTKRAWRTFSAALTAVRPQLGGKLK